MTRHGHTERALAARRLDFYARHMNIVQRHPVSVARLAINSGLYRSIQYAMKGFAAIEGIYSKKSLQRMTARA